MAQTNYTPISLYYSTTASAVPTAGNLVNGELAINITDGKLFYKDNTGTVRTLANVNAAGTVSSVGLAAPAMFTVTNSPVTGSGTLTLSYSGTALPVANGGTGQTTYTDGQLLIGNSTGNTLTKTTLTAGSGITITNGAGSITISSTGGVSKGQSIAFAMLFGL